jgi:phage protein D
MPTNTVILTDSRPRIDIDGNYHPRLTEELLELETEETLSGSARCRATFSNFSADKNDRYDFTYFDLIDFNFGQILSVSLTENLFRLYYGRINVIEAQFTAERQPTITIEAEDAFQVFRMQERTRVFENMSDEEIAQQVASENGLSTDVSLDGPTHGSVSQLNQSDYVFLVDRVRAAGGVMWIEPGKLVIKKEIEAEANPEDLEYGAALKYFTVRGDLRNQSTAVGVAGWDMRNKSVIHQSATDLSLFSAGGETGARTLEQAFGQRQKTLVDDMAETNEEAEELANSYFREQASRFVTGEGVAKPLPDLHVGRIINIRGAGKLFEGTYTVTKVRHLYDAREGLRTEFEVARPWIGPINQLPQEIDHACKSKRSKRKPVTSKRRID